MSREGGFPKYQSERISLCPVALHTSGDEPGEFDSARAESGSACTLPNLRNAQIFHQSQSAWNHARFKRPQLYRMYRQSQL